MPDRRRVFLNYPARDSLSKLVAPEDEESKTGNGHKEALDVVHTEGEDEKRLQLAGKRAQSEPETVLNMDPEEQKREETVTVLKIKKVEAPVSANMIK